MCVHTAPWLVILSKLCLKGCVLPPDCFGVTRSTGNVLLPFCPPHFGLALSCLGSSVLPTRLALSRRIGGRRHLPASRLLGPLPQPGTEPCPGDAQMKEPLAGQRGRQEKASVALACPAHTLKSFFGPVLLWGTTPPCRCSQTKIVHQDQGRGLHPTYNRPKTPGGKES